MQLGPQAILLAGFAETHASALLVEIDKIRRISPLRHMITRGGKAMSVAMTNCGEVGWISDLAGYRYVVIDPETNQPWPAMPTVFRSVAEAAAEAGGFARFAPDACLINQFRIGARMSLHQDRDERDFSCPIVSVSLGLPAIFLWGGEARAQRPARVPVAHGDVVVWGGVDRLAFHGVSALGEGVHSETGAFRYNLTFRTAR